MTRIFFCAVSLMEYGSSSRERSTVASLSRRLTVASGVFEGKRGGDAGAAGGALEERGLRVRVEHALQRVAHLALGRVHAHAVEETRHEVLRSRRRETQGVE